MCSRKTKGGAEGCSKGPSSHWQCCISAAEKKKKNREGLGSFDALVPASAQVCIWIIFGFSGDLVVVVVVTGVFFPPLGVSTSILQTCQAWKKLISFNQSRGYLKSSCVWFLKSSSAEWKFALCRKKSCPILSGTAIKKKANRGKKS